MGVLAFLPVFFVLLGPAHAEPGPAPAVGLLYTEAQARALPGEDKLANYAKAVAANGGRVVVLSQVLASTETAARLDSIAALLVPGGNDVDPALYGEKPRPELEAVDRGFDDYELAAVRRASARGLPILGICKGHQLLDVSAGGSLYQDLPAQLPGRAQVAHRIRVDGKAQPCYHEIRLRKGSLLNRLFKTRRLRVNSYHHQGVKTLGAGFQATAWSQDGLVEAMERGGIFTVQFHPEKEREADPAFDAVFRYFIGAAAREASGAGRAAPAISPGAF